MRHAAKLVETRNVAGRSMMIALRGAEPNTLIAWLREIDALRHDLAA